MRDIDENINDAYSYNNATTISTTRTAERGTMDSLINEGTLGWLKCLNWS